MTLEKSNKVIGSLLAEVIELKEFTTEFYADEAKALKAELKDVMDCDCTEEFKDQRLQMIYEKVMGKKEPEVNPNEETINFLGNIINKKQRRG